MKGKTLHQQKNQLVKFLFEISVLVLSIPHLPASSSSLFLALPTQGVEEKFLCYSQHFRSGPGFVCSTQPYQDSQKKNSSFVPQTHPLGGILTNKRWTDCSPPTPIPEK